jgi:alpha-beta hydrolase superfamily lysophospholipase
MKHKEGFFKGVRDAEIYHQRWLPEDEPKAVVLIAHGLAEHSGRYMNVVNHLVPLGYAVYALDHPGHGKSAGTRVYVDRFEDFTDTLHTHVGMVRADQPDKRIFLIGHSMGGLISALYLLDHQREFAGAVLSGPAVKVPDNVSSFVIFVGKIFSALIPKLGLIRLEAEGVSRDPEVVEAYVKDPLVYTGKTTARLGAELLRAMQRVTSEAGKIKLSILFLQGSADRLVDPDGAQMLYDTVQSSDKTIKIYEGLFHEVFNEPEHNQVLNDVAAWLDSHLGAR